MKKAAKAAKLASRPETVVLSVEVLRDFLNGLDALARDLDRMDKRLARYDATIARLKARRAA